MNKYFQQSLARLLICMACLAQSAVWWSWAAAAGLDSTNSPAAVSESKVFTATGLTTGSPTNLLQNPGFEEMENGALKDWKVNVAKGTDAKIGPDLTEHLSGKASAAMVCPAETDAEISQTVAVKGGSTYVLEVNYKAKDFRSSHHLGFGVVFAPEDARPKAYKVMEPPGTCDWRQFRWEVVAPAGATQATVRLKNYLVKGTIWFDDVYFGLTEPGGAKSPGGTAERRAKMTLLGYNPDYPCLKIARGGSNTVFIEVQSDGGVWGHDAYQLVVRPLPKGLNVEPEQRVLVLAKNETGLVKIKFSLAADVPEWFCEQAVIDVRSASRPSHAVPYIFSVAAKRQHPFLFIDRAAVEAAKKRVAKYPWARQAQDEIIAAAQRHVTFDLAQMPQGKKEKDHVARACFAAVLGQAYLLTGEERFARKTREILLAYADGYKTLPKKDYKDGRATGQTINESEWALGLIAGYDYVYESPAFTAADHLRIENDFFRELVAVLLQGRSMGWMQCSNWGATQNAAIGMAGFLLQDRRLIDEAVGGEFGFAHQIGHDLLDDGQWWEGAPGYHYETVCYGLIPLAEAAWRSGLDLYNRPFPNIIATDHAHGNSIPQVTPGTTPLEQKNLILALTEPIKATFPNGEFPANNDSTPFFIGEYGAANYELGYLRCQDPDAKKKLAWVLTQHYAKGKYGRYNAGGRWIYSAPLWNGADVIEEVREMPRPSGLLPDIGWAFLREKQGQDTNEVCVMLDYGPYGGGHGHPDKLTMTLYGNGQVLTGDPGIPGGGYGSPLCSLYWKQTLSHNGVTVDGRSQAGAPTPPEIFCGGDSAGKLLGFTTERDFKQVQAEAVAAYPGVRQTRTLAMVGCCVIDVNDLSGETSHTYDYVLHGEGELQTDAVLENVSTPLGNSAGYEQLKEIKRATKTATLAVSFRRPEGSGFRVIFLPAPEAEVFVAQGPRIKDNLPRHCVIIRQQGQAVRFVAVLQPLDRGEAEMTGIESINGLPLPNGEMSFMIAKRRGADRITISKLGLVVRTR